MTFFSPAKNFNYWQMWIFYFKFGFYYLQVGILTLEKPANKITQKAKHNHCDHYTIYYKILLLKQSYASETLFTIGANFYFSSIKLTGPLTQDIKVAGPATSGFSRANGFIRTECSKVTFLCTASVLLYIELSAQIYL